MYWHSDLLDMVAGDWFSFAIYCSLCNNDDIQTGTTASLLNRIGRDLGRKPCQTWMWSYIAVNLHLSVFYTDVPPILHLEASLGWTPSQRHRPEQSPRQGSCKQLGVITMWNYNLDCLLKPCLLSIETSDLCDYAENLSDMFTFCQKYCCLKMYSYFQIAYGKLYKNNLSFVGVSRPNYKINTHLL